MAPIDVLKQSDNGAEPKFQMSLVENTFTSFLLSHSHGSADMAAKTVFGEGSLFSPFLFGKFFDPVDAFPLWEFESDTLLAALRGGASRTTVDWAVTDSEYCLRAEIPGGMKCHVEVSRDGGRVMNVSGLWCKAPTDGQDWRAGRWWEHGFVRRVELPEDADCGRVEAYFHDGDGLLEIKVFKKKCDDAQAQEATD